MQIHGLISESSVNGPGRRAVVWFQGCTLGCPGCWNPRTHAFGTTPNRTVSEVSQQILASANIDGVTFSGGEPFQQAQALLALCEWLKVLRPTLSLGLFSGYTTRELTSGRWQYRAEGSGNWEHGTKELFDRIRAHLDFGIFGRFTRALATNDKPLCGSRNQEVVFFNDRYSGRDLQPQGCEINISQDGEQLTITGFPPADFIDNFLHP